MKITLTVGDIVDLLRVARPTAYSYNGAWALADYLDQTNDHEDEFDAVATLNAFWEYDDAIEAYRDCRGVVPDGDTEDEMEQAALKYLQDNTVVIQFVGGIIVLKF